MDAFPIVKRELDKLPRAYIANVIYTLTGAAFVKWVEKQVNDRNAKVAREANMIEMDSQIAAIYQASTAVSGKSRPQQIRMCPLPPQTQSGGRKPGKHKRCACGGRKERW